MKRRHILLPLLFLLAGLSLQAQPVVATETKAKLNVIVTDFEDNPLSGEKIFFQSKSSGKEVARTTGPDGKFELLLPKGDTYQVKYLNFLEEKSYSEIEIPNERGMMEATLTVQMESIAQETFALDIHFQTDKAIIQAESYPLLDELLALMNRKPSLKIELAGHTDSDGSEEHNLALSKARAVAVKDYLVSKGITPARITSTGFGESKPVADNTTPAGKAQNRRTEVRVL